MDHPLYRRILASGDGLSLWLQETRFWQWMCSIVGAGCIICWWCSIAALLRETEQYGLAELPRTLGYAMGRGVLSFALLVGGAIMLAPVLAPVAARPFLRLIDSIYLGGSNRERPPLVYSIAERRIQERRYSEAAEEFERLSFWHPYELRLYLDGIRVARWAEDYKTANRLFRRGRLRCASAMSLLEQCLHGPLQECSLLAR